MSELRQNRASKEWVVIAPQRKQKPNDLRTKVLSAPLSAEEYSPTCPFCPGNEKDFSIDERTRIGGPNGQWAARVIDNKYKILDSFESCPVGAEPFDKDGIYHKLKG